jgi:hypothetical protein
MVDTGVRACPVCAGQNARLSGIAERDAFRVACHRCGNFLVSGILLFTQLKGQQSDADIKQLLPYLSAYIRQANDRGEHVVLDDDWQDFAAAHKNTPISRKATKLLELIAARSEHGHSTTLDEKNDLSLVDAKDSAELSFLLRHLIELGCINRTGSWTYALKVKAWEQLQPTAGIPGKCFVAMSFDESLKNAYQNGIFLAIKEDCKLDPVRMDLVEHNEKICDKMIAEIRTCQFLVADVTLQRPNVYFEGGFAMGLGRPVIWTCREDDRKKVQFDTRQYNHIFWKDPNDLRIKLADRIRATIPVLS